MLKAIMHKDDIIQCMKGILSLARFPNLKLVLRPCHPVY